MFDNLESLPLAAYELEADWGALGDLARQQDAAGYQGEDSLAIPLTHERYRIAGYDKRLVHQDLYLTFIEVDGRWSIGGDDDLEDLGLYSARNVWDFSRVRTTMSKHFLALEPDNGSSGDTLVQIAETSSTGVDRYWTRAVASKGPVAGAGFFRRPCPHHPVHLSGRELPSVRGTGPGERIRTPACA